MHIYDVASQAERARDPFRFYQAIRDLAPKQPYRRIMLRSPSGDLLGPSDAADTLCAWYAQMYAASDSPSCSAMTWPFTVDELEHGFSHLPAFKALDPAYAPAPIWKMAAEPLAHFLHTQFQDCCHAGAIPQCWSSGVLTFLHKPGKRGCRPEELRPITLLEPSGKVLLGLVAQHLLHSVFHRLCRWPQMAYLPFRGCEDSIARVRAHCAAVRQIVSDHRFQIHQRANHTARCDVAGGVVVSLDISKAFDHILRPQLYEALRQLEVDSNLIALLMNIYSKTTFSFTHRNQTRVFDVQRGIRQGCKAAPILWCCYVAHVLTRTASLLDFQWIADMLTAFADDFCLHCLFESSHDVHVTMRNIGCFLDILHDAGLTVNMSKTVAVLKMVGPGTSTLLKRYVKRTKTGSFLHIPSTRAEPELDETEHRLRVQEFLQYARGMQFLALGQQQELTSYFLHRCILCEKYVMTTRGMIQHWEHDHTDSLRRHGAWYDYLQHRLDLPNPCPLCGIHYQRMHQCLILRQYALYLAHTGQLPPRDAQVPSQTYPCTHCSKVYMTKHGLDQHLRRYHAATQVGPQTSTLTAEQVTAQCIVMQAVEDADCSALLDDENVTSLLSRTCLVCQRTFKRKQELSRHIKSNHAHWWHQCATDAATLEQTLKPADDCFCDPPIYNRKHLCMPFIQYALLRIHLGHAPDEQAGLLASPDMLLSSQEIAFQLAWLGMLAHLLLQPALKLTLTLHCQVCGSTFPTSELLAGHLKTLHSAWLEEAEDLVHLLNWALFNTYGCFCNPVTPYHTVGHQCTTILQLAIMLHRSGPMILIPWTYRATELIDFFEQLLPSPQLTQVTRLLMTRQFEAVLSHPAVYHLLTHRCPWCHDEVTLSSARAHVLAFHHFDLLSLQPIILQLATQAARHHGDGWYCEYCQELLPSVMIELVFQPQPLTHLRECEYIRLVALLISFPVWHKPAYELFRWPDPDEASLARQQLNLQQAQFNVGTSDHVDTFGLSYEPLALCIWGGLLTPEQLAALGISKDAQTSVKRPRHSKAQQGKNRESMPSYEDLLQMVARLALRTEDSVNQLLQDHQYVLHLHPGPGSLIPTMLAASQAWHQGDRSTPLRHHLVVLMINTLLERLEKLAQTKTDDPAWIESLQYHIVDSQGQMPFLRWDSKSRTLVPSKEASLPMGQVIKSLKVIQRLIQDSTTTLRFHSLVKISEDKQDRSIPWLWMISSRNNPEAWNEVRSLCFHSSWQLIRLQIRPQGTERSTLAKSIHKALSDAQ
eukprot:s1325_g18.t1